MITRTTSAPAALASRELRCRPMMPAWFTATSSRIRVSGSTTALPAWASRMIWYGDAPRKMPHNMPVSSTPPHSSRNRPLRRSAPQPSAPDAA